MRTTSCMNGSLLTVRTGHSQVVEQSGTFHDKHASTWSIMKAIYKTEGAAGLYKGLHAQLVRTVLASALMLATKEHIADRTSLVLRAFLRFLKAKSCS